MNPEIRSPGSLDKAVGRAQEKAAKLIGSEELEWKGKVRQMKGDWKDLVKDSKEAVLEKANDWVDELKDDRH